MSRKQSRQQYQKIRRIINLNTGGYQPPGAPLSSIGIIARQSGFDGEEVSRKLRALRQNNEILRYRGTDGAWRYCLRTEDALEAVVAQHNERGRPPTDVIEETIAPALSEVRDDG